MMPDHYVEVNIKNVDFELTKDEIVERLKNSSTYRTTKYILLRNGRDWAVVKVRKRREPKLFPSITGLEVLSLPGDTVYCEREEVDVHNRTLMTRVASSYKKRAVIVKGRWEHISFILDEPVLNIRIVDVEPPASRLMILAEEVVQLFPFKKALKFVPEVIDLAGLSSKIDSKNVAFPCRASGLTSPKKCFFIDENPTISEKELEDITLVGCRLSKNIFRSVYRKTPKLVNMCPKDLAKGNGLTLGRCCQYEEPRIEGSTVFVPWGATIHDVHHALKKLVKISKA